ncbi:MAG: hypothetical protein ACOY3P_13430, partial [Planctomycetota bacterium]
RTAPSTVEEAGPPIYYLPDKDGKLQAVLGFTLEEFERLYRLKHEMVLPDQRPLFSLQRIQATGRAAGDRAELDIRLWVQLRDGQWNRVPLRLNGALLKGPAEYKGAGEHFLHFEEEGEGYVSWIRGEAGGQHEVALKVVVPLSVLGNQTRLRLAFPRATTSELSLTTSVPIALGEVSEGATLQTTAAASPQPGTRFTAFGISGDFQLTWRRPTPGRRGAETVLEAATDIFVRLDSRSIDSEATISVQSYGGAFDAFRVQLPPGAELVPTATSGYTVGPASGSAAAGSPRVVEVRLEQKTSGPVDVRLTTRAPVTATKTEPWSELAGFEVMGAARQSGKIAVAATSDWQVLWGASRGVRQTDASPEMLRREDVVTAFEYFVQPFSLPVRLAARRTRISVEPEYRVLVTAEEARLDATFKYSVRGARVPSLEISLADWVLDDVGPEDRVAWDGVEVDDDQVWTIPLLSPDSGPIELTLKAHWPIVDGASNFAIKLPLPKAATVAPAALTVATADNVELTPDLKATKGLVRELPANAGSGQLLYRGEAAEAVFAAQFQVQPQKVEVVQTTHVEVAPDEGRVEQHLAYSIAYEPADRIILYVPDELAGSDYLDVLVNGIPQPAILEPGDPPNPELSPVVVTLPEPMIGACDVLVRFPLSVPAAIDEDWTPLTVPLVVPADEMVAQHEAVVVAAPGLELSAQSSAWRELESADVDTGRQWSGAAAPGVDRLELALRRGANPESSSTVIEQAFVQTWFGQVTRQDRAVFRVSSNGEQVTLRIPAGAADEELYVMVDGQRVMPKRRSPGLHEVPLPTDGGIRQHLLEARYYFPSTAAHGARERVELPRLEGDVWVRRLYWQLALPKQQHLLGVPPGLVQELIWGWTGWTWGRRPTLEQPELEQWCGAPNRTPLPAETNRYLFSTFGPVAEVEIVTVSRPLLVMVASGAVLAFGLLLIYVPILRHPITLFLGAVAILATGVLYPQSTLLLAQAALLGLALVLLASILKMLVNRGGQRALPEASRIVLPSEQAEERAMPNSSHEPRSTRTAPMGAPALPRETG